MGVNCQEAAWQLTAISNCCWVRDLGGLCCVLLCQNRPSNTQQAPLLFHEDDKKDSGRDNNNNILFVEIPATLQ
eukprot:11697620-Ditylum_brightwellii.AAC.1